MKKRKHFKFKRLIIRIVSVISIISILISSVVLSVSADTFDNVSFNLESGSLQPNQLFYGKDYYIDDNGVGHNGSVIYRGYRMSGNDILWGDSTYKSLNNKHVIIQFSFSQNLSFISGQRYTLSFPLRFYGMEPPTNAPSIFGKITLNKLSLVRFSSDTYYYDVWQDVDYNVLGNGYVYLNYTFTMRHDFVANGVGLGFNYEDTQSVFNVGVLGFDISGSLDIKSQPTYIMPDFSDQDNNQALEDEIRDNGGDAFAQLDNFYESLAHLGDSFDFIKQSMFKSTFIFSTLFTENELLSDILYFSLVIGLCGFIIGAIGSVVGWASGLAGREFGRLRNAKEREASRDFNRRNRRR